MQHDLCKVVNQALDFLEWEREKQVSQAKLVDFLLTFHAVAFCTELLYASSWGR